MGKFIITGVGLVLVGVMLIMTVLGVYPIMVGLFAFIQGWIGF